MKLPAALEKPFAKFDQLSLRERALTAGAVLVALIMIWTMAVFDPLSKKENYLSSEIITSQDAIATAVQSMTDLETSDPTSVALAKEKQLEAQLRDINTQLASRSGGLIEPERMVQVIHDVLSKQRGIMLISLQNKPVTSLIQPAPAAEGSTEPAPVASGPYVHPVELIVEGQYLDVLEYLRALEALPWRFNWKILELTTKTYPINRVRIELSTLSMDTEWIGV